MHKLPGRSVSADTIDSRLCSEASPHRRILRRSHDTVQRVLSGRKLSSAPKLKHNPAFPLKHFVKCGVCGTPLTGGMNKGKVKHYANYWCRNSECRAVKVSKSVLESEFIEHLRTLRPEAATFAQFPAIAADVWARRRGDTRCGDQGTYSSPRRTEDPEDRTASGQTPWRSEPGRLRLSQCRLR